VYNPQLVRQLCREINNAKGDTQREEELLSLLQAVIEDDHEEVRIRMAFLRKKYGSAIRDSKAAD
jgi:hypothetical protein